LRETRFGHVLYRADVLLKELANGSPMLHPGPEVKANKIDRYMSARARDIGSHLISNLRGTGTSGPELQWTSFRLWFDVVPGTNKPHEDSLIARPAYVPVSRKPNKNADRLRALLTARGYELRSDPDLGFSELSVDGETIDLSQVFPKMFVRIFDNAAGRDLPGSNPAYNALSADVNQRTAAYAVVYPELRELVAVVRAYVAAVHLVKQQPRICGAVPSGLLESERSATSLPPFHQSELSYMVMSYVFRTGNQRRLFKSTGRSISGGVVLAAQQLIDLQVLLTPVATMITRDIKLELAQVIEKPNWVAKSGRDFVALRVEPSTATAPVSVERSVTAPSMSKPSLYIPEPIPPILSPVAPEIKAIKLCDLEEYFQQTQEGAPRRKVLGDPRGKRHLQSG
jgi:hypothetical protein